MSTYVCGDIRVVCSCFRFHTHMFTHTYTYIYTYTCLHTCIIHKLSLSHTHTHTIIYMHTDIHIYTHANIFQCINIYTLMSPSTCTGAAEYLPVSAGGVYCVLLCASCVPMCASSSEPAYLCVSMYRNNVTHRLLLRSPAICLYIMHSGRLFLTLRASIIWYVAEMIRGSMRVECIRERFMHVCLCLVQEYIPPV